MDGEKHETDLAKSFATQFAEFIEKSIPATAFPSPAAQTKVLSLLRDPEPLPAIREELLAISEHYSARVKQLSESELKNLYIAACDPVKGNLAGLPDTHKDMAQSLRTVLKTALQHATGQSPG
jgi:hypothetical protein